LRKALILRIFLEGSEEWLEPLGKVFCILSAFALVVGAVWFVRQEYIWHRWPVTTAVVIDAKLTTSEGEDGVTLCGAAYQMRYLVGGTAYTQNDDSHVKSSDCEGQKARVASARGTQVEVLYSPEDPNVSFMNPGYNLEFFFLPFWCLCFATAFTIAGIVSWRLGQYMTRHKVQLP
jgi:hypothetical protein